MMKKYIYYLVTLVALAVGCNDEFLEREPLDLLSEDTVFKDQALVEAYLFKIYNYMPVGYGSREILGAEETVSGYGDVSILDTNTDILRNKSGWPEAYQTVIPGLTTAVNNPYDIWEHAYRCIRNVNNLLFSLEDSQLDADWLVRIRAEARFVRAFMYFDLVRRYGDVPLISTLQSFDDSANYLVARTSKDEIYEFVNQELIEIAEVLPSAVELPENELGRATREACWALNGRSLLYAERYELSSQFSKMVMDSDAFQLAEDYNALFQSRGGDKEVIFEVLFDGTDKGHGFDRISLPFSFRSDWGSQTLPTQDLVDSYEMLNGLPIADPLSGYDPQNPFVNRDKRLDWTVLHEGSSFKGEVMDIIFPDGKDALNKTGNHTITGYYLNKFMDQSLGFGPAFGQSVTSWKELRLAEVILNYAEAQNEFAGPDDSVYGAMSSVRARAGLPSLPTGLSKDEMFARIVNERKVELVGEGHRFWDLRRWEMGVDVLNGIYGTGMKITRNDNGSLFYETFEILNRPQQVYLDRFYLMPIPQSEIDKNPQLTQNPGY